MFAYVPYFIFMNKCLRLDVYYISRSDVVGD